MKSLSRRSFLHALSAGATGVLLPAPVHLGLSAEPRAAKIADVEIKDGVTIVADNGQKGVFAGSRSQNLDALRKQLPQIRELFIGRLAFDFELCGELLWESIYPGRAKLFAEGRDPLSGKTIANQPRSGRHLETGRVFMAFSTVDIALWDLRGKLAGQPAFRLMGDAGREKLPVYWRPGEASKGLKEACQRAREAFDRGYVYQKWYFTKAAQDGEVGFKQNVELARTLREAVPEAHLMFDNHSIRYHDDVDYSVRLCKAVAPYQPFWIEEPICPEHVDGYAKIKELTGVTIAGGEHWHTRWQVLPFLERKCVDYVQSDPIWCGGISEWLQVCRLASRYEGVQVVPHITSPWLAAPHCVASQPESLCPLLEFNCEGGRKALESRIRRGPDGRMMMALSTAPGVS